MKLRIRGNSLRLRLGQAEVARVGEGGRVEETVAFGAAPEARLVYAVEASATTSTIAATYAANVVTVALPLALARSWAAGDAVGLEAQQAIGGGGVLSILVEKDFACLKPRTGEDDTDAFPHPATA